MSDSAQFSYLIPPESSEQRAEWLRLQEERIAAETRSTLERIIDSATERFTNTLVATGDMAAFDSIPVQWERYVDDTLITQMQGLFLSGGVAMYMDAERVVELGADLATEWVTVVNQSATDYALDATNRLKDVGQGTWNTIKNNVSKAIEQGTSNENLRKILMDNNRFSRVRADAIARTEVANAYNNGNWTGMQALGEYGPTHKYWIAAQVGNSRPTHLEKHGDMLPINEPYIVGGEPMLYPHAPGVSAKNAVNCRCEVYWLYPGQQNPITGERAPQAAPIQSAPVQPAPQLRSIDAKPFSQDEIISFANRQRLNGMTRENFPKQVNAVDSYLDYGYKQINEGLRSGTYANQGMKKVVTRHVADLDSLMSEAPGIESPIISYRGVRGEFAETLRKLQVGDEYVDAGFVSTSLKETTAREFTPASRIREGGPKGMLIEITNPQGTKGLMPLAYKFEVDSRNIFGEVEWLLPRGTRFRVMAISEETMKVQVVL